MYFFAKKNRSGEESSGRFLLSKDAYLRKKRNGMDVSDLSLAINSIGDGTRRR